jgi:enoyl-CoA hydratase/carnithine racemase
MVSVVVEKKQRFGAIRIDHVANMNALSPGVVTQLENALSGFASDADIRVILLTGTGLAFSAGADIRYMANATSDECRHYLLQAQKMLEHIESMRVPVIAVVNGVCTGGGCALAGACDLAIAADSATFGEPEARIGVPAAALWEEAQRLAARVTSNSPTAVAQIKRLLRGGNESGAEEINAFLTCLVNGEGREGMQAFLEKRQPQW